MEWISRGDVCSGVVPKDLDGFPPSPDSWSEWGATPFENFMSEMKRNDNRSYVGAEDCNVPGSGLCNDVHMENFGTHEESFNNAATSQDLHCDMDRWSSYPPEQLEFHLDNMDSMDHLDDVFLSSLLDDCPTGVDASDESADLSTNYQCSMQLAGNQERDEHSNPYLLEKTSEAAVHVNLAQDRGDSRLSYEETSVEDSVLHHLENITAQLTEQTKMCFRDALYRLADNSKHGARQSGNVVPDQSSRWFSKEETSEMRTNAIDRTVANLLFSSIEVDISEGSSLDLTEATGIRQHSGGMLWHTAGSSGCDVSIFSG